MKLSMGRTLTAMFISFLLAAPIDGAAQGDADVSLNRENNRIPITIVMADGTGAPVIMRRSSEEPRNLILINPTTTERQLEGAIFAFLLVEAQDPEGRQRTDHGAVRVTLPSSSPRFPGAQAALQRLRNAPHRALKGLAAGAASVEIWVSPRRGHHR